MNIEDYTWNKHEQKTKEQTEFTHSNPKIKIMDNNDLRNKIEEFLEDLSQKLLTRWALNVASAYLDYLDNHLKNDPRIKLGIETLENRREGRYALRNVGFIVNELAKESKTEVSKYAGRSFAQAIATGHMRGHAMVSSDYAIKVVNTLIDNCIDDSTWERKRHLKIIDDL